MFYDCFNEYLIQKYDHIAYKTPDVQTEKSMALDYIKGKDTCIGRLWYAFTFVHKIDPWNKLKIKIQNPLCTNKNVDIKFSVHDAFME